MLGGRGMTLGSGPVRRSVRGARGCCRCENDTPGPVADSPSLISRVVFEVRVAGPKRKRKKKSGAAKNADPRCKGGGSRIVAAAASSGTGVRGLGYAHASPRLWPGGASGTGSPPVWRCTRARSNGPPETFQIEMLHLARAMPVFYVFFFQQLFGDCAAPPDEANEALQSTREATATRGQAAARLLATSVRLRY